MELNIGSGDMLLKNCVNFDVKVHRNKDLHTDVIGNAEEFPFKKNSFDKVYMIHVLEHFNEIVATRVLRDILRILKPIGTLLIETPDIRKCYKFSKTDKELSANLFGDANLQYKYGDEYCHRSGWTLIRIEEVLKHIGYNIVSYGDGTTHGRPWRDFRIVGQKCVSA